MCPSLHACTLHPCTHVHGAAAATALGLLQATIPAIIRFFGLTILVVVGAFYGHPHLLTLTVSTWDLKPSVRATTNHHYTSYLVHKVKRI